ncbi:methylated-DNA--[protein]-cysteine S-methyltransferase [Promicromonospora sp. NPDC057138]|uniref:methylated-DNA--[protein]-cysteine S-methyltransferase n=1 Tax=Promicromonospora sp. NPDC057138 TaxID=3346031 RepID=UPI0036416054
MNATTLTTPDGPFSIIVDTVPADSKTSVGAAQGAVLAAGWTADLDALLGLVHPSLRPAAVDSDTEGGPRTRPAASDGVLAEAADAVRAYYDGDHGAPGRVPVVQASGPFRTHAWDVLREVKAGERLTYSEYAVRAGRPAAVRAAAGACAMNAAALFVPCHRILRTDGTLGGFRYGLPIKESLLAREGSAK